MTFHLPKTVARRAGLVLVAASALLFEATAFAQENLSAKGKEVYDQVKAFQLGGAAEARGVTLKRDRAVMTFDGTFYFAAPVEGRVTGAVFVGEGTLRAEVPPGDFEKDNVKRLLGTEVVESDFKTAVLRFTDDTPELLGLKGEATGQSGERAQKLASELNPRILKETGANLAARVALSLLNDERPGFFFASFDGGSRGRFHFVLDQQTFIPVATFGIDAGERGLLFNHRDEFYGSEVWMAFHSLEDYGSNRAIYADVNDLLDSLHYRIELDLRDPAKRIYQVARLKARTRVAGLRVIPFRLGEYLPEYESQRLKKQLRLKSARVGGAEAAAVQEDWEGGLTVFLPRATGGAGEEVEFEFELEGDFMRDPIYLKDCFYPSSNIDWYPRHGFLDRASFDLTFRHRKNRRIAATGVRLSEEPDPEDKEAMATKYRMEYPVDAATFAIGPFERHTQMVKWEKGGEPTPVEFNSLPGRYANIKEDFILAEMDNSLRFFSSLFGKYPYPIFSAAYHPFGFGQGMPGLLMIPAADEARTDTYAFIAHETAHQWWGNVVTWRSYRDEWVSEGFAEYSGLLYTGFRQNPEGRADLLTRMRRSLRNPPYTRAGGLGKGRLNDVGPIILGRRLDTTKTGGAYQTLVYNKGALVLRMLHYLFTDFAAADDKPFFEMMSDFVARFHDKKASTDDFREVANQHFARTGIARKFGLRDLNWFFIQWVYQTGLPSYRVEYHIEDAPGGEAIIRGDIYQEGVPEAWAMPLPLVMHFDDKSWVSVPILALGPKRPFAIKLPRRPKKVELDPTSWILSEKTSTEGK
jgi:hypothetical protein